MLKIHVWVDGGTLCNGCVQHAALMKARVCIVVRVLWQIGAGVFLLNAVESVGLSMLTQLFNLTS